MQTILAIETSCDETAIAVLKVKKTVSNYQFEVLSNVVASQIDIHKKWGGVYPELASRAHLEAMIPVLTEATRPLDKEIKKAIEQIDSIAVTKEPGLIGSLLMGMETAQILGAMFNKPVINVNHLEGHIYSAFCAIGKKPFNIAINDIFPILALVVSGGHTSLLLMQDHLKYKTVAKTIDDAAGEAFDKVARIMGLPYPGGPEIEKLAKGGNENAYNLPIGLDHKQDFSFSGLKTAVLYLTKDPTTGKQRKYNRADLAASFQKTVSDTLIQKTKIAVRKYEPKTLILSGGVSANSYIRDRFQNVSSQSTTNNRLPTILIPPKHLSTDNAIGIGVAGAINNFNK